MTTSSSSVIGNHSKKYIRKLCFTAIAFKMEPFMFNDFNDSAQPNLNQNDACTDNYCRSLGWPGCSSLDLQHVCPGTWLDCLVRAWQVSGHDLKALARAHRHHLPNVLPTVFHFGPVSLVMLVDVRGFSSGEVHVEALGCGIRLRASQQETVRGDGGQGMIASRLLDRTYEFAQGLSAGEMVSSVKEGTLFVTVPWAPPEERGLFTV